MSELPSECGIKVSLRPMLGNDLLKKYQVMISSVKVCKVGIFSFFFYFKKEWDINDLTAFTFVDRKMTGL